MTQKIALFGAAGAIGNSIAAELQARGLQYRVVGRSREQLERSFGSDRNAEIVTWNPDDPRSVEAAATGIETIVYLVGVPYWQFELHPLLMERTLRGAQAAGVAEMLLVGTVYPYGLPRGDRVTEDHPREPHTHKGRMRKAQEDLLLDAHAAGTIRGTVLRLPDFFGPNVERSIVHGAFRAALDRKTAQLIGPIDAPHQYVFTPDVGPVVLALASEPRAYGRVWHFAGSGTILQREFVRRIFAEAGAPLKMIVVNKTMLRVLGTFDKVLRELVEMNYLQTNPVILDDSALHALLGGVRATSYDEAIRLTLEAMRRSDRIGLPAAARPERERSR
jgi:nucleoside-diphosphate-sugar epimerase